MQLLTQTSLHVTLVDLYQSHLKLYQISCNEKRDKV
jgi:hypothetical protein